MAGNGRCKIFFRRLRFTRGSVTSATRGDVLSSTDLGTPTPANERPLDGRASERRMREERERNSNFNRTSPVHSTSEHTWSDRDPVLYEIRSVLTLRGTSSDSDRLKFGSCFGDGNPDREVVRLKADETSAVAKEDVVGAGASEGDDAASAIVRLLPRSVNLCIHSGQPPRIGNHSRTGLSTSAFSVNSERERGTHPTKSS
mmetsp:Transcript_29464/g.82284  ORF Transcript_29464/g.82284 Transcript_29464/m.82284 type:complete len:201 (+) Transcript_29464:132-734(+)